MITFKEYFLTQESTLGMNRGEIIFLKNNDILTFIKNGTHTFCIFKDVRGKLHWAFIEYNTRGFKRFYSSHPKANRTFKNYYNKLEDTQKESFIKHVDVYNFLEKQKIFNIGSDVGDGRIFEKDGKKYIAFWENSSDMAKVKGVFENLMSFLGIDPNDVLYKSDDELGILTYTEYFRQGYDSKFSDIKRKPHEKSANLPSGYAKELRRIANEDLRDWVKQRWVNIGAKKKNGKYQPCGRKDSSKGKYPKCVPAKKAYNMSDSEKKSAVSRKRKAQKSSSGKTPTYVKTKK